MKNHMLSGLVVLGMSLLMISCGSDTTDSTTEPEPAETELKPPAIAFKPTGNVKGKGTQLYTLTNGRGIKVDISNYGGIVTSILAPDKDGNFEEVTLGFDTLRQYLETNPFFGALVGRYGNRIAKGQFTLDGQTYNLAKNNMGNHLHGGEEGFDKVVWSPTIKEVNDLPGLVLKYTSADGEEGYPGKLDITVMYSLNQDNELKIDYTAKTDKPTVVNLTNHTYFNLTGNAKRDILDHVVTIKANRYVPVDETLIPTGELERVNDTPFDFTQPTRIGDRIDADHQQIEYGGGYDHCWVLNRPRDSDELTMAAKVREPNSGRTLEVYTTEPGVQFYTGNFLDGSLTGIGGVKYEKRYGFCLETEHFPDSPNQPSFPSVVLKPGETYHTTTIYKFGVE
ncbi:aldose epimerase family protein [Flavilitoribacter nigricans]|uniref:Aldose 1-epimerase n=1 Tax=Flavilitoribacter nigricans (strain ATCC 23147 / DSM 23189 / NBRC 102662 / NCIMB 1420 / SS-2) TaxID=1122177 RepID=A0A2D0MYS9_FLAN2|nr:aldose epimerase family protein [Flavilitoribacter nigricans]PHN01405.1 galactose-1-epimerase [Flavilitoribacter nigricans DSM 23189 = NBRC 102662]